MQGPLSLQTGEHTWIDLWLRGQTSLLQVKLLIFCIIAPLSLLDGYHLRLKKNGKYTNMIMGGGRS